MSSSYSDIFHTIAVDGKELNRDPATLKKYIVQENNKLLVRTFSTKDKIESDHIEVDAVLNCTYSMMRNQPLHLP